MKGMVAMSLTALETHVAIGWQPDRDIVVALLANERRRRPTQETPSVDRPPEHSPVLALCNSRVSNRA